jgi:hypothetical protein
MVNTVLQRVLLDIRYLLGNSPRRSSFGDTKPGDDHKFHLLQVTRSDIFLVYSLGRINIRDNWYFDLTESFASVYTGDCGELPSTVSIHISCNDGHPHYTSLHGENAVHTNPQNQRYKCHMSVGGFTYGDRVNSHERELAECVLRKLYRTSSLNNITSICGGGDKFRREGRSVLERNGAVLGVIRLLNEVLYTNITNYLGSLDSEGINYDTNGTDGIRVPDREEFRPNTKTVYRPLLARREVPDSPRTARKKEERRLERERREQLEQERLEQEFQNAEQARRDEIERIREMSRLKSEDRRTRRLEKRKLVLKEPASPKKRLSNESKQHLKELSRLRTPTPRPLNRQQTVKLSPFKPKNNTDLLRARSDQNEYNPKVVKRLFVEK